MINITFHGIGEPQRQLERGERAVWVSHEQFLSLLDRVADRDDVRITFDDGNASDLEHGLPALAARGLNATFFVVAGRLQTPDFLGHEDVRTLAAAGMEIGCHGMSHRPWRGLRESALRAELVEAKAVLERVVGLPVTRAACPFGAYDRRVLRMARASGYQHVYTSDGGTARRTEFLQARHSVAPHEPPALLERIVATESSGPRALVRRGKLALKRWR